MSWGYNFYPRSNPTDPVKLLEKLKKKNPDIQPVIITGKKIAISWWGISWNRNLERYADYENRIGRGRTYVRQGRVLDLKIAPGLITALVAGSGIEPYKIQVTVSPLQESRWQAITEACKNRVGSLQMLMEGRFPEELADLFFAEQGGLFPEPKEIMLSCNCPDWADMCKHVAAALYGVGARLDQDPLLFFTLRDIDFQALLQKSAEEKMKSLLQNAGNQTTRTLSEEALSQVFGEVFS